MNYLSEFAGCFIFLLAGYSYTCNVKLKNTLIGKLSYIDLVFAWALSVGFGIIVSTVLGGPAYLNPGVVIGNCITGSITAFDMLMYILMEFLGAGAAVIGTVIFFYDSFRASETESKRGIFSAYPVVQNIPMNFVQELMATFFFMFVLFISMRASDGNALVNGAVGAGAVALLALSLNSTGFSMNAMRSFFSSIWFAVLPIPNKNGEKPDWKYQITVNLIGSSIGGILAVIATAMIK